MKIVVEIEWDSYATRTPHGDRVDITPSVAAGILDDVKKDIKHIIDTRSASEYDFEIPVESPGFLKDVKCTWKFYSQERSERRSQFSQVSPGFGKRETDVL